MSLSICPDDAQVNMTALTAVLAPQERLQVPDEPMGGLAKPLHGDQRSASALTVDAHAVVDHQVLNPGVEKCLHIRA
jgi:hypothetical protein